MTDSQDILFDVAGQSLYLDAPEGRPSSVTSVTVYEAVDGDDGTTESATSGSPAVENATTELELAAGFGQADPRKLELLQPSVIEPGRRYLITQPLSTMFEWFEVTHRNADAAFARHPLHNSYSIGADVESTRMTQALSSTWVADDNNISIPSPNPRYRVRWVYVVAGSTYVRDTYFDLVRYAGDYGVQPQDVELLAPGWLDRLPIDHRADQGRGLIKDAYRAVKMDLHGIDRGDESEAHTEVLDELVRYKAIVMGEFTRYMAGGGDPDRLSTATGMYQQRFDSLVRVTAKVPSRNSDNAGAVVRPALPLLVR